MNQLDANESASEARPLWRSLEELAGSDEFTARLQRELPAFASEWDDPASRRHFLRLMGASLALAGVGGAGCAQKQPTEKIVPYVRAPEQLVPGKPLYYATALALGGYGCGVLVESHMGRPTKVEGNPTHPASLGGTDVFAQAAVLGLYDPDRSQVVTQLGQISTWTSFLATLSEAMEAQRKLKGAGLRVLTETITSPTLASQLQALLAMYPEARWHQYEPLARDNAVAGARMAFGKDVEAHYRLDRATVIVALDADFFVEGPGRLRYARDFADRRDVLTKDDMSRGMNRLYAIECTPTLTGAMAEHRLPARASEVPGLARALATQLGVRLDDAEQEERHAESPAGEASAHAAWIEAVARDLLKHRGESLVIAGDGQPPAVHALVHAMNQALGNIGKTVLFTEPVVASAEDQVESLRALVREIDDGKVQVLVILGGNPVYNAPADVSLVGPLSRVKLTAHLSLYDDETSTLCQWHLPEAHPLESWSDLRAYDGTATIVQPLIAPLYEGKSAHEVIGALMLQANPSGYEVVREHWRKRLGDDFESAWARALHDGLVADSAFKASPVELQSDWAARVSKAFDGSREKPAGGEQESGPAPAQTHALELVFRADPTVHDGRFANNAWLQELPKPLTKLTWDNAALLSKATADRLGVASGDVVELACRGRSVRAPVWVAPGHADDAVTVHFGYGRIRSGRVGSRAGFNAYALRTTDALWWSEGLEVKKTGKRMPIATTQHNHLMEGRDLVRVRTLDEARAAAKPAEGSAHVPPSPSESLYAPGYKYEGYAWGMAINLDRCIGCNACMVACQAENNIPVVGKEQVLRGREMHWIRIDQYYDSPRDIDEPPASNPRTYHQPVPCMHCENAPCELVCPVAATVHDAEGLNTMVYNRCVGTRYCSNNCPYKVRRFNFLQFSDQTTPSLKLLNNPDVTVRTRGVMEKCTYCIQRINAVRYTAEEEDRPIRDGEIVTACQGACPTRAIVFGDQNDRESEVAKLKASPLSYALLESLNTRPRTTYLPKLTNPNPDLDARPRDGT